MVRKTGVYPRFQNLSFCDVTKSPTSPFLCVQKCHILWTWRKTGVRIKSNPVFLPHETFKNLSSVNILRNVYWFWHTTVCTPRTACRFSSTLCSRMLTHWEEKGPSIHQLMLTHWEEIDRMMTHWEEKGPSTPTDVDTLGRDWPGTPPKTCVSCGCQWIGSAVGT